METVFVRSIILGFCVGLVWTAIWSAVLHFRVGRASSPYLQRHSHEYMIGACARRDSFARLLLINRVIL